MMRRGFLRLRSSSAPRRGLLHLGYLRELGFVAMMIGGVLFAQQSFRTPATPDHANSHSEQPVYGMTLTESGKTLWVSRERYGISQINLADGLETDRWLLFQSEASFAAHGGDDFTTTMRYGLDRRLDLFRGNETIHSEVLPEVFGVMADTDVSKNGRVAVVVSNDKAMKVWRVGGDGTQVDGREFVVPDQLDHVAATPDGKTIALVSWSHVYLWNVDECRVVTSWKVSHGAAPADRNNRADTLAWSQDARHFAIGFDDGIVRIWNVETQSLTWEHKADAYKATAVAFDSTGSKLATGGFDKQVRVWDLTENRMLWEREHHSRSIHNLVFAADDNRLYSGSLDGKVCEWAAATGTIMRDLP
ncbi:MAG: hypothetical protein Q8K78_16195 [Planctomycetaceae bacterium]|nr:hypothetical protein [Planctomycetaceae bacterium]